MTATPSQLPATGPGGPGYELEKTALELGFIPLTDCAPLVAAYEKGWFKKYGLEVRLVRENSWATIRDKVSIGMLDGAHMLAAMPIASTLGMGSLKMPMITAFSLNLNGNGITVSNALYERMQEADPEAAAVPSTTVRALQAVIEQDKKAGRPPLTFAMVFPVSSHHYLLRTWLADGGIDPDRDVRLIVIPPPQMVNSLRAGTIVGYCVGAPWNALAVREGLGRTLITSYEIWNQHPEKVFGVNRDWAEKHPNTHRTLLMALWEACRWLDQPENRPEAVELLAEARYVGVAAEVVRMSMTGGYQYAPEQAPVALPDFIVFHRHQANLPRHGHAVWFLEQMMRWGQIEKSVDIGVVAQAVYRPDLYREALEGLESFQ